MSPTSVSAELRLLAITQGRWGERIADNISRISPTSWRAHRWNAPPRLPQIIDDPADFLPQQTPQVDLVLALGETPALVQLIPDIVKLSGARSVIAPIDRNESLPPGLAAQLKGWLNDLGVAVVFPKPLCSLTETTFNQPPIIVTYDDPIIQTFARRFGRPELLVAVNGSNRIGGVTVTCDSACGCARFVAEGLVGCSVEQAEYEAGMLHHHYPCLASMNQDADYNDTLMHVSGHTLRVTVKEQIKDHLQPTPYLRPQGKVEADQESPL
ncbi:MAG TPA: DUF166 family protein [Anaerolineales bacterium]|nr:DUF166 family protein [Anaerolineales bacterium]